MYTSTTSENASQPLSLDQLSAVLMNREKVPFGFFLSQALWNAISERFLLETGDPLAPIPTKIQGVRTALDPSLPDTEFNVAFTEDAWSKRLRELRR